MFSPYTHTHTNGNYMRCLTNLIVVNIFQYKCLSNYHILHLNLYMLYVNYLSLKLENSLRINSLYSSSSLDSQQLSVLNLLKSRSVSSYDTRVKLGPVFSQVIQFCICSFSWTGNRTSQLMDTKRTVMAHSKPELS